MNPAFFFCFFACSPFFLKHTFDIILKRKEGTNVLKGIKLRLYPNRTQQNQLEQMFGNDRFVW
ncbi:helix-turn-helix domain-containing protein, partial [Lactobacillus helveticus]|uniref:helix-turn-helix domain-containing protein n=1 Tax=Lactobacillus helveticus TaxID=1587 RepID=UPI0021C4315F